MPRLRLTWATPMRFQAGQVHLIRLFAAMVGLALLVGRQMPAWSVDACPGEREVTMIVVELLQSGFAGQSGERTSIGEDGCFTVDRVLNDKVSRLRSGRLALDQILSVRAAIDIANIASLPIALASHQWSIRQSCQSPTEARELAARPKRRFWRADVSRSTCHKS